MKLTTRVTENTVAKVAANRNVGRSPLHREWHGRVVTVDGIQVVRLTDGCQVEWFWNDEGDFAPSRKVAVALAEANV